MFKKNKQAAALGKTISTEPTRVILVEDKSMQQRGYREFIEKDLGYQVISSHNSPQSVLSALTRGEKPDLILCDLILPPTMKVKEGILLLSGILQEYKSIRIIAYSEGMTDWALMRLVEWGVSCFEPADWSAQSPVHVKSAIELVLKGFTVYSPLLHERMIDLFTRIPPKPPLTLYVIRIAAFHLQGLTNNEISSELGNNNIRTVANHISAIYREARIDRAKPNSFDLLMRWFEEMCAEYGFEFDPKGKGIDFGKRVWITRASPLSAMSYSQSKTDT